MLTTLRIKNLALVEDLTVEFQPGFNAVSGETGAGKSIILGALNLVLGERADRTLIRSGADSCSVEASFDIQKIKQPLATFLDERGLEPCEGDQLLLKRSFSTSGTNRQFINGSATSLQILAELGELLVDIHGPHEHQSLLHPSRQLQILDAFGGLEKEVQAFQEFSRQRSGLLQQKRALIVDEKTYAQQLDLLRFQVQEIQAARLQPAEEDQVEAEYHRASNAAELLQWAQAAQELLAEADDSVLAANGKLGRMLLELHRVDAQTQELIDRQEQITSSLQDLQAELSAYLDRLDLDPERLQFLEERVNLLQSLKRKYGPTLEDVMQHGQDASEKLQALEQRDAVLEQLQAQLQQVESSLEKTATALSQKRKKLIPSLCQSAMKQLAVLGFKQSQVDVAMRHRSLQEFPESLPLSGLDEIEFLFSPNVGEPGRPLRAIASSGEMARVMLAFKTVLAEADQVPVLVFDEVDANVGGETARAVGEKMKEIGRRHQVLCITHLAPVAASAKVHFVVAKEVKGGRTISQITLLDPAERIEELARMLGGAGEAARKHAAALLGKN